MSLMNRSNHGRNNLKRNTWTPTDFSNEKRLNNYCNMIYRYVKAFPDG